MLSLLIAGTDGFILCGAFENASGITAGFSMNKPDVILMDIDMPEVNGLEGVKQLRTVSKDVPVIMWTVFDSDDYLFEALRSGANGYLLKGTAPLQIIEAIKEVLNGGAPMTPSVAKRVLQHFSDSTRKTASGLTTRETEILARLVDGKSYKMIAEILGISLQTVKTHLKNIYDKLHVHSQTEAVAKAIKERLI
jgi:DNA-binding NarL/FixJ family response regulator